MTHFNMTIHLDALFLSRRAIAVYPPCAGPSAKKSEGDMPGFGQVLRETSMRKLTFGFILILYVAGFATMVGATNYHEYRKFDASCSAGSVRCDCSQSQTQAVCCYDGQVCSCTGNVPHCRSGLRR